MNYLPLTFYDEVIHRLDKYDIGDLKLTSGRWSSIAEAHYNRRRELNVRLKTNSACTKVGVKLRSLEGEVPFKIDFKYDRIRYIHFSAVDFDDAPLNEEDEAKELNETLEQFRTKTLPMIRAAASDCMLSVDEITRDQHKLLDIIFDGLKECRRLLRIRIDNYGEKSHAFIRRHIELRNLERLSLVGNTTWPADFQDLIKVFVKSPRYKSLFIDHSNLTLDFDMVAYLFGRFVNGELPYFDLTGRPSFPLDDLISLYPQFLTIPEDWPSLESTAVWKVPLRESNLQVTICGELIQFDMEW